MKLGIAHPLQNDTSGAALVVMVGVAGIAWWFWHLKGPERDAFLGITGTIDGGGGGGGAPVAINPFGTVPIKPGTPIDKGNPANLPGGGPPLNPYPPFNPIGKLF